MVDDGVAPIAAKVSAKVSAQTGIISMMRAVRLHGQVQMVKWCSHGMEERVMSDNPLSRGLKSSNRLSQQRPETRSNSPRAGPMTHG